MKYKFLFIIYVVLSIVILFFPLYYRALFPLFVVGSIVLFWIIIFSKQQIYSVVKNDPNDINSLFIAEHEKPSISTISDDFSDSINKIFSINESESGTTYFDKFFSNLALETDLVQGLLFLRRKESDSFTLISKYAYYAETEPSDFIVGEGIHGQVAKNKAKYIFTDKSKKYIISGLGKSNPQYLIILPVFSSVNNVIGILELSYFKESDAKIERILDEISVKLGSIIDPNLF